MIPRLRVQTLVTWFMVAACVLLGWLIQRTVTAWPSTQAVAPAAAPMGERATDPAAPAAPASIVMPNRDALAVIVERPVFSETRRPSDPGEGPAPALDFTLVGVVLSERERSAIVQPLGGGAALRLAEGEAVGGWTVVDIAPDRIVVRRETSEAEMPLDYSAPAPPSPSAKTPAPNGSKPNGATQNSPQPIGAAPSDTEAPDISPGIIQDQPPEVLPPPDDDDGDAEPDSTD